MKRIVANLEPEKAKRKRTTKQSSTKRSKQITDCIATLQGKLMKQINIDLVDKRHIIARSKIFKNGAEVLQFPDEAKARDHLEKWLESFAKDGYTIEVMYKDCFRLQKD